MKGIGGRDIEESLNCSVLKSLRGVIESNQLKSQDELSTIGKCLEAFMRFEESTQAQVNAIMGPNYMRKAFEILNQM